MPEKVAPGPVHDAHCIREAVCIDTKKIFDSCKEEDMALLSLLACKCLFNLLLKLETAKILDTNRILAVST